MLNKNSAGEASVSKPTFVDGEIGELRKYIVEMMHAEMILMENIKFNEHNVAIASARIKHFKELIGQERARCISLNKQLERDTNELKSLEETQVDAEAKNREFRDAVAQRESDVQVLRKRYQQLRTAMLSLKSQILDATKFLDILSSKRELLDKDTQNAFAAIDEFPELSAQRADRQTLWTKIRSTQQFIAQTKKENTLLDEKRAKLEDKVYQCDKETFKLREKVSIKEKETEVLFTRLRNLTVCVNRENGKIEGKLKTKRRKYRLKMKNEISTLKRRISFITTEVDKSQMTNEDTLSNIDALSAKRNGLGRSLIERNEQIAAAESAITELSTSIVAFGQNEGKFNVARLEEALSAKRDDAQAVLKMLEEKQKKLNLLETDHSQLDATFKEICAQIITAKDLVEKLDGEMVSLSKGIEDQEATCKSLSVCVDDATKKNDDLQTKQEDSQRENESIAQAQATLRRQQISLLEQEQQLASEIKAAELLSQTLCDGIKHGVEYVERLQQTNALCDNKDKRIEFELRRQELSLQQQCAQEESRLEADVAAMDKKITLVERQLRSF